MHFHNFINKWFRFLDPLIYPFYSEYVFFIILLSNLAILDTLTYPQNFTYPFYSEYERI